MPKNENTRTRRNSMTIIFTSFSFLFLLSIVDFRVGLALCFRGRRESLTFFLLFSFFFFQFSSKFCSFANAKQICCFEIGHSPTAASIPGSWSLVGWLLAPNSLANKKNDKERTKKKKAEEPKTKGKKNNKNQWAECTIPGAQCSLRFRQSLPQCMFVSASVWCLVSGVHPLLDHLIILSISVEFIVESSKISALTPAPPPSVSLSL